MALPLVARELHLLKFAEFCRALAQTLQADGLPAAQVSRAFQDGVSAVCIGCGLRVAGDELYALSQTDAVDGAPGRVRRLHLGDCACAGCGAWFYRLAFQAVPAIDWPGLLARVDTRLQPPKPRWSLAAWMPSRLDLARPAFVLRAGAWIGLILLLLLARQCYYGGRVPLLREPERFRVTPDPQEEAGRIGAVGQPIQVPGPNALTEASLFGSSVTSTSTT